jgi:hypothetical protein
MKQLIFILLCIKFLSFGISIANTSKNVKIKTVPSYRTIPDYEEAIDFDMDSSEELEERCFTKGKKDNSKCRYNNRIQYEEESYKGMRNNTDPHFTPSRANQKPVF